MKKNNVKIVITHCQVDLQDKIRFDLISSLSHNHRLLKLIKLYIFSMINITYQEHELMLE